MAFQDLAAIFIVLAPGIAAAIAGLGQRMLGDKYDELMGARAKATPLKRCVTADDVAEVMLNLLQGNRFVTGEIVVIDGGFTAST